jgi:serine/threonine protein kinase
MQHTSSTWAVRCFHKQIPADLEQRYTAISQYLTSHPSPHFLEFSYLPDEILVHGRRYPVVKMEWGNGETLGAYIGQIYRDSAQVTALVNRFIGLVDALRRLGIAHGDLQHGNILATDSTLTLIDYDGMFVPGMGIAHSAELGNPDYQSPIRTGTDFGPDLDRFSVIVIWLALEAIRYVPGLWERLSSSEYLLLSRSDFADPARSEVLSELEKLEALSRHVVAFRQLCRAPLGQLPSLNEFIRNPDSRVEVHSVELSTSQIARLTQSAVFEATDLASLQATLGDRVTVVGKVREVYEGLTRYGKPYVFLNFGDWRADCFTVVIWPELMSELKDQGYIFSSLEDTWVSVVGLVQSYAERRRLRIILDEPNEIRVLKNAAARALLSQGTPAVMTKNQVIVQQLLGRDSREIAIADTRSSNQAPSGGTLLVSPNLSVSRNQEIRKTLQQMHKSEDPAASKTLSPNSVPPFTQQQSATGTTSSPISATNRPPAPSRPVTYSRRANPGWAKVLAVIAVIVIAYLLFA